MKIEPKNIHILTGNNDEYLNEEVIIYIVRPKTKILENFLQVYYKYKAPTNVLIYIPGETYENIEFMTYYELTEHFNIFSFNIDLLPIDNDLLTLVNEDSLKEIYIDKNLTAISELANAFVKLESCFGKVTNRYIKGDKAKFFADLLEVKEKENEIKTDDEILGMIVLDRSIDFLTVLATNYSYEGLIDDFYGISFGSTKLKESYIKKQVKESNKKETFHLTSFQNSFYSELGCMHYLDVKQYLFNIRQYYENVAKRSKESKKASLDDITRDTADINTFVKEVKNNLFVNENILYDIIQNLSESDFIEYIKKEQFLLTGEIPPNLHLYYEDYICDKKDLIQLLKLMVIESLTQGGIENYNLIKRDILNFYGYQNIFLFRDLERLGWLKEKQILKKIKNLIEMSHGQLCTELELISNSFSQKKIEDCSYVMSGFCPISLRLIERAVEGKWNKILDTLKKMPGELRFPKDESEMAKPVKDINTIFLVFVGGVTYAEIAGVRYLNKKFKEAYDKSTSEKPTRKQLIIVTTGIISNKKIFSNLGKTFENNYTMKKFYEQFNKEKK